MKAIHERSNYVAILDLWIFRVPELKRDCTDLFVFLETYGLLSLGCLFNFNLWWPFMNKLSK